MPDDPARPPSRRYAPSMTSDYSRISETARAVERTLLPRVLSHLDSMRDAIAAMPAKTPFVIADYGAADGANSESLFERAAAFVHEANPSLRIRLVYIDIADQAPFERFREGSPLSALPHVEMVYLRRSFYGPVPELAGSVHLGYSSTALHWLDATADPELFRHPTRIHPNQLPETGREVFAEKWRRDWRVFFHERSRDLVDGGRLLLATLADLGGDRWPAFAGYDGLRDACRSLCREGRISPDELEAIFIPSYFATPSEMKRLVGEDAVRQRLALASLETTTVPCAYIPGIPDSLDDGERRRLAETLARVVRAWSESSIRVGLSADHADLVDEIYRRLADAFFETPRGLPYQYCLVELVRMSCDPSPPRAALPRSATDPGN
ncbi:MAG: hypothetical protein ABFC89_05660 [Methanospirillum sp.]